MNNLQILGACTAFALKFRTRYLTRGCKNRYFKQRELVSVMTGIPPAHRFGDNHCPLLASPLQHLYWLYLLILRPLKPKKKTNKQKENLK